MSISFPVLVFAVYSHPSSVTFPSSLCPCWDHPWKNNYKDNKTKCRHLKNWPVKGLCGRCLLEFIGSQPCYFRPSFVNYCPSNLLCVELQIYRQCVTGGEGWGVYCWVLLETIFCRRLKLRIWPDSVPKKLLPHPKQNLGKELASDR